ncbi:MAG: TOBE domain-containing protein [Candidatus Odinarchaeia archaeon]
MADIFNVKFKIWFEKNGKPLIGEGGAKLLQAIKETGNLKEAIQRLGWSYRYAWGYIKKLEERLNGKVVLPYKGGFKGGGGMKITPLGEKIIKTYSRFNNFIKSALKNTHLWMAYGLKNETVNRINGFIKDIHIGSETAMITIEVPEEHIVSSIITSESVKKLAISKNEEVKVVIKATEIMVDER